MGIPNYAERRVQIARAVERHLLDGIVSRLSRFLFWGGKQEGCVKHFCQGVYMQMRNTMVHEWGYNKPEENMDMVQQQLARAWDTVRPEDEVDPCEFRTFSSPPELVGLFQPDISGRSDLVVPADVVTAMQHMTNTPLRIDTACWEVMRKYRTWLYKNGQQHLEEREHVPFTLLDDNSDAEKMVRYHEMVETDRIADHREFFICYSTADEVCRIYGKRGYGPNYSKLLRSCTRVAEARPLSERLEGRWVRKLEKDHGCSLRFGDMDKWAESCASLHYLKKSHNPEEVGAAFAWLSYRKTGLCDAMVEIDAPASGYGHILAEQGKRGNELERWVNMTHPRYQHPYNAFADDIMRKANIGLRVAPKGMSRKDFIVAIVQQFAKPAMVPGQYGSGHIPMAATAMGLDYVVDEKTGRIEWDFQFRWVDEEGTAYREWEAKAEKEGSLKEGSRGILRESGESVVWRQTAFPKYPDLLADRFSGLTCDEICQKMVAVFKKVSLSLKRTFPELVKLNKRSIEEWVASMGEDGLGLPPTISNKGYEFQPSCFRIVRGKFKRLQYRISKDEDKVELNHIHTFEVAASGTSYLAKRIQAKDATTKRCQYVRLAALDDFYPSIGNHDADLCAVYAWDEVERAYNGGYCDTHPGVTLSEGAQLLR